MRKVAAAGADVVIVTTDDPYSEDPQTIIAGVMRGARADRTSATFVVQPDRARAIEQAVDLAEEGDILLVTGRGHESHQSVGGRQIPFDDREHLRQAMHDAVARRRPTVPAPRRAHP